MWSINFCGTSDSQDFRDEGADKHITVKVNK